MTVRYVLILPSHPAARSETPFAPPAPFVHVPTSDNFQLFTSGRVPVHQSASQTIIGQIHSTETRMPLRAWPESVRFGQLTRRVWGAYVAVETADGEIRVLRDPSGALPAYVYAYRGYVFVVSDIDALQACGVPMPAIDWSFLAWHLSAGFLRTHRTALKDLTEIPQGNCATITAGELRLATVWSPWSFVSFNGFSADDNARRLRETIDHCSASMTAGLERVHLGLSGGLDSSILAASLQTAGAEVRAYSFTTDEAIGDERRYAAMAAEAFHTPLSIVAYNVQDTDLTRSVSAHLPRPVGLPYQRPLYSYWKANALEGSAAVTGNGGDEVFCLMQSATPAVDLWLAKGQAKRTLEALGDVCRLTGAPVHVALRQALNTWRRRNLPYIWHTNTRFLSPDATERARAQHVAALKHPWLSPPEGVLPGKKVHVANLLRLQHFVEGLPRVDGIDIIHPLLAQPVVELCLQIPSWQWSHGGFNRAIARQAYADRLPAALKNRQGKGGPEAFAAEVYLSWRTRLIPFLTEGFLASNGIIDIDETRRALAIDAPPKGFDYLRLMELADTEAWVRGRMASS